MPDSVVLPLTSAVELARIAGEIEGAQMVVDMDHYDRERLADSMARWADRLHAIADEATGRPPTEPEQGE